MAWTREQILAVRDLPLREVHVPAWDGATVWLRTISAAERDRYFLLSRKSPDASDVDPENFRARFLVFCLCDELGNRLFGDEEAELLGAKGSTAINFLFLEAQKLNQLDRSETDAVEEARKNS
jgi:hypothetical protein